MQIPDAKSLRKAAKIVEKINSLQSDLERVFNNNSPVTRKQRKRRMSRAGRKAIARAQAKRWKAIRAAKKVAA